MAAKVNWIESAGGPLLLAPRSSIKDWRGTCIEKGAGSQTDYARACSVDAQIGLIPIGNASVVVLGDEPDRTALMPEQSASDVVLVRWRWAESESSLLLGLLEALKSGALSFSSVDRFAANAEEYLLFDSACSGAQIDRYLSVSLQAGGYLIETAVFQPDRATFALVHRLRLHLKLA